MRSSFFIYSLPRSGSSWLSVFLSGSDSFCYHEPTADFSPEELAERLLLRPESAVGAVDTGAYRKAEEIRKAMPEGTEFYVLVRPPVEIERSLKELRLNGFNPHEEHEKIMRMPYPKIFYEDLKDVDYLRMLYTQVIGQHCDEDRAKQLAEMNVERDVERFLKNRNIRTVQVFEAANEVH